MKIYKKGDKNSKLPPEISNLMGEANQLFVMKDYEKSREKLFEIIKQCPNFSEPYNLLAIICGKKKLKNGFIKYHIEIDKK